MSLRTATTPVALEYIKTIGMTNNGSNGRGFCNPYALQVSKDGRIFVLNRCDHVRKDAIRVGICNLDEEYLGEFGKGFGTGDENFGLPTDMAFDSHDRLHITDEHLHRVTVYDSTGTYLHKWGEFGSGDGQINGPSGIAFDSSDNAYIVDQHNNRVQKFTSTGDYLAQWGKAGDGPVQFNLPWGLAVDSDDNVYIADWRNDRVQKFSADGEFVATFGQSGSGEGQLKRPSDVVVDGDGYVYVADWGNERVQIFNPAGDVVLKLRGQATLSKWSKEFFASNPDEVRTRDMANLLPNLPDHLRDPQNESSQTEPYFWGPVAVTLDATNRLYVTEHNRHRFQVYSKV